MAGYAEQYNYVVFDLNISINLPNLTEEELKIVFIDFNKLGELAQEDLRSGINGLGSQLGISICKSLIE
jgi:hypothetical protein